MDGSRTNQRFGLIFIACCLLSSGCVALESLGKFKDCPPQGPVFQIHALWDNRVQYTPDPANGGKDNPGLAGRLYLFGAETGFPLEGDGKVLIDLYDASADKEQPRILERWSFDRDNLKRLLRKDMIGWGYTLFLPWATYNPQISQVTIRLCYVPDKGAPMYAPPSTVTLNNHGPVRVSNRTVPAIEMAGAKGKK